MIRFGALVPILLFVTAVAHTQLPAPTFPETFLWNAESRGPLLMVLPCTQNDGNLVSCGSVTVYAPRTAPELRWENLPEPDLFANLSQPEKWALFQASLTERQWKLLGSAGGLGQTDLRREQRTLFFALLPQPLLVNGADGASLPVEGELRRTTRLRLSRLFHYGFTNNDGRSITAADSERRRAELSALKASVTVTDERKVTGIPLRSVVTSPVTLSLDAQGSEALVLSYLSSRTSPSPVRSYGVELTQNTATHLKPGDLDFAAEALNPLVSLEGAKTVGELIARAATATHQELFCDPRYASQSVYLRGSRARAGDLLKALCWGVSGAFRQVGSSFVLTQDRVPLAIRLGHIADWKKAAQARIDSLRIANDAQVARNRRAFIAWNAASSYGGTDRWRYGQQVALNQLPDHLQRDIRKEMDQWANQPDSDPNRAPLNRMVVSYLPRLQLEYLVPNVGVARSSESLSNDTEPDETESKPLPFPKSTVPRTLAVAVASPREAQEAATRAKAAGFTALWVQVGLDDVALLAEAVRAGESVGIPVSAIVRPLRATGPADQTVERRRSTVYLRPDLLESQAAVLPRIKALAATPHLAGLVFTDLTPPGYGERYNTDWRDMLGYADPMRLACLRAAGPDPVDLSDNGVGDPQVFLLTGSRSYVSFARSDFVDTGFQSGYYVPPTTTSWFSASRGELWQPFQKVRQQAVDTFVAGLTQAVSVPVTREQGDGWDLRLGKQRRLTCPASPEVLAWNDFVGQYRGLLVHKPEGIVVDGTGARWDQLLPTLSRLENP